MHRRMVIRVWLLQTLCPRVDLLTRTVALLDEKLKRQYSHSLARPKRLVTFKPLIRGNNLWWRNPLRLAWPESSLIPSLIGKLGMLLGHKITCFPVLVCKLLTFSLSNKVSSLHTRYPSLPIWDGIKAVPECFYIAAL